MKSILLSIKPEWVAEILNGEKTIEVRKNKALYKATKKLIEEQGYATFFMYCTKGDKNTCLEYADNPDKTKEGMWCITSGYPYANGKVVAKFTVRKVDEIKLFNMAFRQYLGEGGFSQLYEDSCLTFEELDKYLGFKNGYAYHIEDLVIFDKPKELWQFEKFGSWRNYQKTCKKALAGRCNYGWGRNGKIGCEKARLTKAPQNFVFVESEE